MNILWFGFILLGLLIVEIFRRLKKYFKRLENELTQAMLESRLYHILKIENPLPSFRGWAISPDIGWEYVRCLFQKHPKVVVECGSGISTLLAGYALKRLGSGRVITLEHDASFAEETKKLLVQHGLSEVVQIVCAPLIQREQEGRVWFWYDLSNVDLPTQIDFLFVDGPPMYIHPQSRFPALPMLASRLKPHTQILIDDASRDADARMIEEWMKLFPLVRHDFKAEKGATLLTFKPSSQP